jgi:hypothetical protein
MKILFARARKNILAAQDTQAKFYDRPRRQQKIVKDDLVLLDRDRIELRESDLSPKYRSKFIGPFRVLAVLANDNFKLELPPTLRRLHDTFHTSVLRPYTPPTTIQLARAVNRPEPLASDDTSAVYEVDRIVGARTYRGRRQYLVKWTGFDSSENTWEPTAHLTGARSAVRKFLRTR